MIKSIPENKTCKISIKFFYFKIYRIVYVKRIKQLKRLIRKSRIVKIIRVNLYSKSRNLKYVTRSSLSQTLLLLSLVSFSTIKKTMLTLSLLWDLNVIRLIEL